MKNKHLPDDQWSFAIELRGLIQSAAGVLTWMTDDENPGHDDNIIGDLFNLECYYDRLKKYMKEIEKKRKNEHKR